ncbi:MAG: 1-deoxy-D-xylulose-5-phosphate reductoisomerase [Alphaproteobacteria bacterium]|jgi:1-deoxy-D-xylulose-5-phosphate reductoisomerase|nr:1-deoxy-D-xylulose-5-phosphate reductoisomerase [Alphaproteobacteria bacterium]MBU2042713.1 1-deoxy-D-xylulose-5-phosphate reductoisomerase [Alphaproteobacteria bacterium]MBU2126164.1 1-deoxy-D-xylulose-5-phosphate reductoisomerase [Alphaproteobacteria bacterium]MBU2208884.1 1-deoxy-D-xylulose-5-phosphate reductoisomerase [Alphaproteobacteria bacterium]MBU2290385.1 1-deoxy-D-xylulose-5-phosphate reductoisomerase [Alphaproteobacteria bacterium]
MIRRRVTVLGSTGSVGCSTLDLMDQAETAGTGAFEVEALTGGANIGRLAEQARRWKPKLAVTADPARLDELRDALAGTCVAVAAGDQAVIEAAARPADWIMAAIVGAAGLRSAWAAAATGATLALANKESLVCCGPALIERVKQSGGRLLPVDSEHSAIHQVFPHDAPEQVARLVLTASGGPFRTTPRDALKAVTPEQAVAHPNWNMGAKISVDSATMANKGLEAIEAAYLFDMPADRIAVVVHPESIIHSLVEYVDGSTLAQMGPPDMKTPIAYALGWPDRLAWDAPRLDLAAMGRLTFEAPDEDRFPALKLAREALQAGGSAPIVFNAANEVAALAFLDRRLGFLNIAAVVADTMSRVTASGVDSGSDSACDAALAVDAQARRMAESIIRGIAAAA